MRAQGLADRRRDGRQFLRELDERVAETVAETRSGKERLQALGGAVEAIGEDAPDPIGPLRCRTLKLLIRLGKRRRTGGLGIA